MNTNFYNLYIFVNLEHLCVQALSYNEKQQGMNTKTFTICPFSINFERLCVKNCLQRKTARLWTLKLFNLFIFINFEHLCVKTLFYNEKQQEYEPKTLTNCSISVFSNICATNCCFALNSTIKKFCKLRILVKFEHLCCFCSGKRTDESA